MVRSGLTLVGPHAPALESTHLRGAFLRLLINAVKYFPENSHQFMLPERVSHLPHQASVGDPVLSFCLFGREKIGSHTSSVTSGSEDFSYVY